MTCKLVKLQQNMENELGLHGLVVMPGNPNQEVNHVEVVYASRQLHAFALYLTAILACKRQHCEDYYRIIKAFTAKLLNIITFSNSKHYFIYFNTTLIIYPTAKVLFFYHFIKILLGKLHFLSLSYIPYFNLILNISIVSIWSLTFQYHVNLIPTVIFWMKIDDVSNSQNKKNQLLLM